SRARLSGAGRGGHTGRGRRVAIEHDQVAAGVVVDAWMRVEPAPAVTTAGPGRMAVAHEKGGVDPVDGPLERDTDLLGVLSTVSRARSRRRLGPGDGPRCGLLR